MFRTSNFSSSGVLYMQLRVLVKGKAVPLQAWSGPEGSRKLRFPDFITTAQDGGKVVSLTHRPPLSPENTPGTHFCCRSQWPRALRPKSSAARLLRLWFRILPRARIFVCCECCVLSGRGLCDELITRPEESYRLWRVVVCDQETSKTRRLKPATGL